METYCAKSTPCETARECGVLIADDEPAIRDALQDGLRREGFSVWLAADGDEALSLYHRHGAAINVALLDVLMPFLDGPATMIELHRLSPQLPCCFMSGQFGHYTAEGLRRSGARAVIKKPFRLREVAQLLRNAVESIDLNPVRTGAERDTHFAPHPGDDAQKRDLA